MSTFPLGTGSPPGLDCADLECTTVSLSALPVDDLHHISRRKYIWQSAFELKSVKKMYLIPMDKNNSEIGTDEPWGYCWQYKPQVPSSS